MKQRIRLVVVQSVVVGVLLLGTSCNRVRMPSDACVQELRERYEPQRAHVREHTANYDGKPMVHFFAGEEPGFILAATAPDFEETWDRLLYGDSGNGLWITRDNGATWHAVTNGFDASRRAAAIIHDRDRDILYAAWYRGGVSRSRDGGQSWEEFSEGLPGGTFVYGLALHPRTGVLTATVALNGIGAYLRAQEDTSWRAIGDGIPAIRSVVKEILPTDNGVVALTGLGPVIILTGYDYSEFGIFEGTPDGDAFRWSRMRLPHRPQSFETISVLRLRPTGSLLAGGATGVWEHDGKAWRHILDENFAIDIVVEQDGRQRMLVRTADKVMLQENGTWRPLEEPPWHPLAFVLQMQFAHGTIYMLTTDGLFFKGEEGVWTKVPAPGSPPHVVQRGL